MADYYQQAIDLAKKGDKAGAEAALAAREQKMGDPNYKGNGGGTSMDAARANIASILAGSSGGSVTTGGSKTLGSGSGSSKTPVASSGTAQNQNSGATTYNGVQYTQQQGAGLYGAPVLNSDVKNYTQNGVTYKTGPSMARVTDPNIIKNGYYISNGYTVFVNENGYATKAVKGVADYTPHQDINAGNGTYNKNGAWTDLEMMGDKEGSDYYEIQKIRAALQRGEINGDEANAAANAIRSKYGYSIDKNGYVTDYGALTRVNDRRQQMGLATNPESGSAAYYRYLMNTDTSPAAQAAGQVKTYQQFAQENGYDVSAPTGTNGKVPTATVTPLPGNSVTSGVSGGGVSGSGSIDMSPGTSDIYTPGNMGDYLSQWYQNAQQQQQNTIDFGTNQAILELLRTKQDADAQFQEQRNQIAIDEAKAKDNQALYAETRGDKGGIGAAQYDAIMNTAAQNRLAVNSAQTKLATDTSRQIADLRAQGEYEKADALLQLSQTYLSQLMSLEQWASEYNLSVAQFNASLQQWQAEYDLKVADLLGSYNGKPTLSAQQFAFNQQQYMDEQQATQEKKLASAGEILLAAGIMPSASQLAAMGLTETEAQSYITAQKVKAAASAKGNGGGTPVKSMDYDGLMSAVLADAGGDMNKAEIFIREKAKEYGFSSHSGLLKYYQESWLPYHQTPDTLDPDMVTNPHGDKMVQIKKGNSDTYMTWTSAADWIDKGKIEIKYNGDGTYTLVFAEKEEQA